MLKIMEYRNMLYIHVPPVQQQRIVDFLRYPCSTRREIEYQQEEMRSHLSKCLWKKIPLSDSGVIL